MRSRSRFGIVRPKRLPPHDEVARKFGQPDEEFWAPLRVIDLHQYLTALREQDRIAAIDRTSRTLLLTSQRLIVIDQGDRPWAYPARLDELKGIAVRRSPIGLKEAILRLDMPWKDSGQRVECVW